MAEPILCLSWNGHANELARVWKTLLENNSFVDCTIAAEGKSLKAHRLILSACSPYFHMLFNEENEKHAIVILKDTSFFTLKTLIDFVYHGKVEIPAGQLETFLELAVSLQIKGLNNSLREDRPINVPNNAAVETHQCSSRVNQDNRRVENSWTCHEDSVSNSSQQCHFHFSQGNTNSTLEGSPVLLEGCSDSAEGVPSRAVMMPLQNHESQNERDPLHFNPEVLINTEQSLKHERKFSEIKIFETRNEVLDDDNHVESMSVYPEEEINDDSASAFEENFDQYSSDRESLHSNENSALVIPEQQQLQRHEQQQQADEQPQQHDSHLAYELASPPETTEQNNQLLPEHELSVPLSDKPDDLESEESTDTLDVPGNNTEEMDEESELTREENPSSGAVDPPPPPAEDQDQEQEQAMPVWPGRQRPANSTRPVPSATELQAHVRLFRMATLKCGDCGAIFASSRDLEDHKRQHAAERQYPCDMCGKAFAKAGALSLHKHRHNVKRPHPCDVCGKAFTTAAAVALHKRRHKGERKRAHPRDVSGKAFVKAATHGLHKRKQTRERPHSCNVCGKVFTALSILITHKRIHTGERPYVCDVCGKAFNQTSHLAVHKRRHTGELPYQCDICKNAFINKRDLTSHMYTHMGERPHKCDVCGKIFVEPSLLKSHKLSHSEERPYSSDVCGKAFTESGALAVHKRTHSGQRPIVCDVCSLRFNSKSSMISHWQRVHETK